jgi:hypothetical protein
MRERYLALGGSLAIALIANLLWNSEDSGFIFASYLYVWIASPATLLCYASASLCDWIEGDV